VGRGQDFEDVRGRWRSAKTSLDHEYTVRRIAADSGLAFEGKKIVPGARTLHEALGNESYPVLLSPTDGKHSCACRGWLRWQRCRRRGGKSTSPASCPEALRWQRLRAWAGAE